MSRQKRSLNLELDRAMNDGVEEFFGFEAKGWWSKIAVPHHVLLTEVAQNIPEYVDCMPSPHEARRTLRWAMKIVEVRHGIKIKAEKPRNGFIKIAPYRATTVNNNASDSRYNVEVEAVNFPPIGLRLHDEKIVAKDPSHPIAIDMAKAFNFLRDKLNTEDVRWFVNHLIVKKLGGIKSGKVAWYVPWTETAARVMPGLETVIRACEQYADDSDLFVVRLARAEAGHVRSTKKAVERTFASEYRKIFSSIQEFIAEMFKGDVSQNSTLQGRLKLAQFLRSRTELYQELLDLRTENLAKALDVIAEATELLIDGAGEYRASIKMAKKMSDSKAQAAEELAAKEDLKIFAKQAEELMEKCQAILEPGEASDEDDDLVDFGDAPGDAEAA